MQVTVFRWGLRPLRQFAAARLPHPNTRILEQLRIYGAYPHTEIDPDIGGKVTSLLGLTCLVSHFFHSHILEHASMFMLSNAISNASYNHSPCCYMAWVGGGAFYRHPPLGTGGAGKPLLSPKPAHATQAGRGNPLEGNAPCTRHIHQPGQCCR